MRKMGRITAGLVMAVMLMTACNKNTGTVAETSGENLVSTEAQETETTTKADVRETTTAKETTKSSTKETTKASKTDETTTAAKKNTETTTAQETTSAKAAVTETTTAQETTSARAVVTETTTQAQETTTAQPETTTQAQTEAPATQPETTTQAPTEAPTQAPTEAPTTQPETTTEAPTEAPTEAGPKSDEELLAEISDPHYGTRAEVNGNVYWYENGWNRSQGAWNGPSLNSIMGNVRDGMEVYATQNSVINNLNEQAAQYSWSTSFEDLGWYDEGLVGHAWTYCDERPCEWHNH